MIAKVRLWGRTIGAVSLDEGRDVAAFQYDAEFARSGIELAPLTMPLSDRVYGFSTLPQNTFHGLPGLLADSLPDKFGNALIGAWLATQGRTPESLNAVGRLCYTGTRGMGALEFGQCETGFFDPFDLRHVGKIELEPARIVHLRQQADFEKSGRVEEIIAGAKMRQPRF